MKKYSYSAIGFSAIYVAILPAACMAETSQSIFFVNAGVGQSALHEDPYNDNSSSYDLNFGYRWGWLGVEAGYADIGNFKAIRKITQTVLTSTGSVTSAQFLNLGASLHGWTLGLDGHWNMPENKFYNAYLSARAGAFHWNGKQNVLTATFGNLPFFSNASASSTNWYAGLGLGCDVSKNIGFGINYDRYRATSGLINLTSGVWSANAEYRF